MVGPWLTTSNAELLGNTRVLLSVFRIDTYAARLGVVPARRPIHTNNVAANLEVKFNVCNVPMFPLATCVVA